jgi:hypothetical protein
LTESEVALLPPINDSSIVDPDSDLDLPGSRKANMASIMEENGKNYSVLKSWKFFYGE